MGGQQSTVGRSKLHRLPPAIFGGRDRPHFYLFRLLSGFWSFLSTYYRICQSERQRERFFVKELKKEKKGNKRAARWNLSKLKEGEEEPSEFWNLHKFSLLLSISIALLLEKVLLLGPITRGVVFFLHLTFSNLQLGARFASSPVAFKTEVRARKSGINVGSVQASKTRL